MTNKIFDCITFYDENFITNARIEILNKHVDYFIICESRYDHKGNKKEINFIGKEALQKIKNKTIDRRFIMLTLKDNKPGSPLLLHDEPIYLKDKIIGRTTSGNYSFNFKKNLAFGYISNNHSNEELQSNDIYIEVEKQKYQAHVIEKPLKQSNFKKV